MKPSTRLNYLRLLDRCGDLTEAEEAELAEAELWLATYRPDVDLDREDAKEEVQAAVAAYMDAHKPHIVHQRTDKTFSADDFEGDQPGSIRA